MILFPLTTTQTIHIKNNQEDKLSTLYSHDNASLNHSQRIWLSMETHMDFHSGELYSTLGYDIKAFIICMIEVIPKIWIPKQEN